MSESDFSGRLLAPVMTRPRRPLSNSASTDFLQHALLVAHDDVGRAQLDQALQAVVAVDDAAIEIVEVRGREAAAVERHQRAQFGRDHRHHVEDHPFRRAPDSMKLSTSFRRLTSFLRLASEVVSRSSSRRLRPAPRRGRCLTAWRWIASAPMSALEGVVAVFVLRVEILLFGQQLAVLERRQAGLGDHVVLEIEDASRGPCSVMSSSRPMRLGSDFRNQIGRPARPARYGPCARGAPW